MAVLSSFVLLGCLNLGSHHATRVELAESPRARVQRRAFFWVVIVMSWEGDQQSNPWNAAFTKRQVLARTWTAGNLQELSDSPFTKRASKANGKEVSM
jgi:hypothetical protein